MPRSISRYGWVPDLKDHRDHVYNLTASIARPSELPPKGGLTPDELPLIWNQGTLGSCTAHGSLRAFCAEAMKQGVSLPVPPAGGAPLSRLMQYYDTRAVEGTTGSDSGGQVRDAIKVLATDGVAPESDWPYNPEMFTVKPAAGCYTAAKQYMSVRYQSVLVGGPGAPMRTALHNKLAIVFGFPVPTYFEDPSVWDPASGEPLPLPGPFDEYIGGHCVAATSYDFTGRVPFFHVDNSWGQMWGMAGRFNMDARWFDPQRGLAGSLWVIQAVE